MEFFLNFDKTQISLKVLEFLETNLNAEEDKKSFARIMKGNKLQYKEANAFLDTLLRALTIEDGMEDIPFVVTKISDDGFQDESFRQALAGSSGTQTPPLDNSNSKDIDPNQDTSAAATATMKADKLNNLSPDGKKNDKPLCKFYVKGKCPHNNDCRFSHPRICNKFRSFGLKIHNDKGCDNQKCQFLHPNACRDSLKTKSCHRDDCRFYHLKGTKIITKQSQSTQSNNKYGKQKKEGTNIETENRFTSLSDSNQKNSKQVFQKEEKGDTITLKDLMKELMSIKARQDIQEKKQTLRSDNQDWRNPRSQSRRSKSQRNPY